MGGHAACWVKAKPNAFSGEKENAKVKIHPCPVTGFVVSYNY